MEPETHVATLERFSLVIGFGLGLVFAVCAVLVWRIAAPVPAPVVYGDFSVSYAHESEPNTTGVVTDGSADSIAFHNGYIVITRQHNDGTSIFNVLPANRLYGFSAHTK